MDYESQQQQQQAAAGPGGPAGAGPAGPAGGGGGTAGGPSQLHVQQYQRHVGGELYDAKYVPNVPVPMPMSMSTYPTPSTTPYYFHEDPHSQVVYHQLQQQLPHLMSQPQGGGVAAQQPYYSWGMPHSYQYSVVHAQVAPGQGPGQGAAQGGTQYAQQVAIPPPAAGLGGMGAGQLMDLNSFENIHKCHFCEKAFKRKSWLKRHLLSHSTMKPYSCPWCHSRHKRKDNLSQHLKLKHAEMLLERLSSNPNTPTSLINRLHSSDAAAGSAAAAAGTPAAFSIKDMIDSGMLSKNEVKKTLNSLINPEVGDSASHHQLGPSGGDGAGISSLSSSASSASSASAATAAPISSSVSSAGHATSAGHAASAGTSSIPPPLAVSVAPAIAGSGGLASMGNLHP
ncbi:AGL071Cp [Eremothecium gossypii ATCC 10895]|uniref:AGL071Cp n=1 Tax=Eremothecium gossypii (strain ATCC 10895 / CBS 109.51 / FGSC 9923 / NRRL Y-1056) TaxID=284811 RepID=Q750M7_EREGS|nr:AGL071Cp [Eremothecium gossypii ATCC 10895]AAS54419.1 AGL071Cp [Eremothecium gossypii ATCC 10895]AEY98750.1 FAGL071Cp [Eremothecium gossypii FDAG1]